jgi:hypothetical protein
MLTNPISGEGFLYRKIYQDFLKLNDKTIKMKQW